MIYRELVDLETMSLDLDAFGIKKLYPDSTANSEKWEQIEAASSAQRFVASNGMGKPTVNITIEPFICPKICGE